MHEDPKVIKIARDSMVLVVAQGYLLQPLTHRRYRLVHPAAQLCLNCTQFGHQPLLRRFPPDDEGSIAPALPTVMCEAQEREGLGFSLPRCGRFVAMARSQPSNCRGRDDHY